MSYVAGGSAIAASRWRYVLVLLVLGSASLALFGRAIQLHVVDQSFLLSQGDARAIRTEPLDAHRGLITDRHGEPLAISAPVATVYADPVVAELSSEDYGRLASALGVSKKWLIKRINDNKEKRFIYLKRKMAPHDVANVMALDLAGIHRRTEYKRYYPAGEVAAHVVGFTDIDEKGQEGVELSYDEWMTGHPGANRVMKNRKGQVIKDLGTVRSAEPGKSIELSLDLRIQYLAYRELKAAVETHRAIAGSIVVLDVSNGDILAMVNQPSYNPNNRQQLKVSHLRNRAITDVFEPGSPMKLATIAAALESKQYTLNSQLNTSPGYLRLGRKSIRDARNYGAISLKEVVSKSSNVGVSKVALKLTGEVVWDMFYRLGFGQGTGIGFPGESIGRLPDPGRLKPLEVATMSYGYGMSVNALQLAQAYMILGNGGKKYPLSLIKRTELVESEAVLDKPVSAALRVAMAAAVAKGGTGTRAQVPMYRVGGKTGTVHRIGSQGYEKSEYKAIFAGVAPIDKPVIAMAVVIDGPQGQEYYGGEVAAPVFSRVVTESMRLLGVSPDTELVSAPKYALRKPLDPGKG